MGNEILLSAMGTSFLEGEVVLYRSPFVAMTFDLNLPLWALFQEHCVLLEDLHIPHPDILFIKIELDILKQSAFQDFSFDTGCFLGYEALFKFLLSLSIFSISS